MFCCPICKRLYIHQDGVIVVTAERRQHRRGRIAWSRDGICLNCAARQKNGADVKNVSLPCQCADDTIADVKF